ncbi:pentapeptide repeat-containing protein [Rhodococcus sp. D2-41]|uniref:pentapeptide repeat-containing protein n=1 Tax=Speluncibacter jeojiensis TaxID=2710754 RepID=UPI00240EB0EF|nr:pentapeptide repeat-containing protein [Rhodococcus sp. D2-41]MDG3011110.1 pentapeptide repeat-containing protein [Rhodococcus sp. D2-41]
MPVSSPRHDLRGDCSNCFALCCTAFGFARSADFAVDKPAGQPCGHLSPGHACVIHARLPERGFRGCTVFDCFGAGQVVSQRLFAGVSWRDEPGSAGTMFAAFAVVRRLHEMLWHLHEAHDRARDPDDAHRAELAAAAIDALTAGGAAALLAADVDTLHREVRSVLVDVSAGVRAAYRADSRAPDRTLAPGADLAGRDLRSRDLCGVDLRGACLIAADLRGRDLTAADLLGADLRDARLDGADLTAALYVTAPQLAAARSDEHTRRPARMCS